MTTRVKTPLEILIEARELISVPERWTQGDYARDREGKGLIDHPSIKPVCYCTLGACTAIEELHNIHEGGLDPSRAIMSILLKALDNLVEKPTTIDDYNDTHTHEEILTLFDKAIEIAKEEEKKGKNQ